MQRGDINYDFEIIMTIPLKSNPSYKLPTGKTAYRIQAILPFERLFLRTNGRVSFYATWKPELCVEIGVVSGL